MILPFTLTERFGLLVVLVNINGVYDVEVPIGKTVAEEDTAFRINNPVPLASTKLALVGVEGDREAVLPKVRLLLPSVIVPLVSVRVPETEVLPLNVTPKLLLMVKFV